MIDTFPSTLDITSLYTSVSQQHCWKTWHTILEEKTIGSTIGRRLFKRLFMWVLSKQFARLSFFFRGLVPFVPSRPFGRKTPPSFFLALQYFSTLAVHCRKRGKLITRTRGNVTSTAWRHGHPAAARFSFFCFFLILTLTLTPYNDMLFSFNQRREKDLPCGGRKLFHFFSLRVLLLLLRHARVKSTRPVIKQRRPP